MPKGAQLPIEILQPLLQSFVLALQHPVDILNLLRDLQRLLLILLERRLEEAFREARQLLIFLVNLNEQGVPFI